MLADGVSVVRPFGWEGRYPSPDLVRDLADAAVSLDSRPLNRVSQGPRAVPRGRPHSCNGAVERVCLSSAWRRTDLLASPRRCPRSRASRGSRKSFERRSGELARTQSTAPSRQSAALLTRAEASLRKLEESLKPDSVRRFLSAVARGGASTELLTTDVIDWLKSHNALGRFRIVAGSPEADPGV